MIRQAVLLLVLFTTAGITTRSSADEDADSLVLTAYHPFLLEESDFGAPVEFKEQVRRTVVLEGSLDKTMRVLRQSASMSSNSGQRVITYYLCESPLEACAVMYHYALTVSAPGALLPLNISPESRVYGEEDAVHDVYIFQGHGSSEDSSAALMLRHDRLLVHIMVLNEAPNEAAAERDALARKVIDRAHEAFGISGQVPNPDESGVIEATEAPPLSQGHLTDLDLPHPDGDELWDRWGIEPQSLMVEERQKRRGQLGALVDRHEPDVLNDILLQLRGEKEISTAQPLLDILGIDSLSNESSTIGATRQLPEDSFRSLTGFKLLNCEFDELDHDYIPLRLHYVHDETGEWMRVDVFYAESQAEAMCTLITRYDWSAPLSMVFPTCRIQKGPGDFCWLRWNCLNDERTLYFPQEADILFMRNGTAVFLTARDVNAHESVMDLARKLDAILVHQIEEAKTDNGITVQ